jgi:hypothetical protein
MANVKPGRAKDNARGSRTVESAEEVYAAMRDLLARKERFTTELREQDAILADPAPAYREVADVISNQALAVTLWTHRRAVIADEQAQFDRAVRDAARRPDGLLALAKGLATGKGRANVLPWAKSRNRQRLAAYEEAVRAVDAYLREPEDRAVVMRATMGLDFLLSVWERPWLFDAHEEVGEHRSAQVGKRCRFETLREKLRKARETREKKLDKTDGVGRARRIIDEIVGIDPEDVKSVQRRSK